MTLKYLRQQLNESDEDDRLDSSDSNNRLFEPLHPIENNHGIVTGTHTLYVYFQLYVHVNGCKAILNEKWNQ